MHGEGEGDNGDGDMREMMAVSLMGGDFGRDARMPPTKQGRKGFVDGGPKLAFSFSGGGGGGIPNPRRRHAESSPMPLSNLRWSAYLRPLLQCLFSFCLLTCVLCNVSCIMPGERCFTWEERSCGCQNLDLSLYLGINTAK